MSFTRGIFAVLCLGLFLSAGVAQANAADQPFKVEFDTSELQVSVIENLPLDALSTKASIEGTVSDTGVVKIPAGGFKMPELGITEPVTIKGFMGIEGPATGTFDETTGQLVINGKAGIWVSVNIAELLDAASALGFDLGDSIGSFGPLIAGLGDLTCGFSPMDVQFSTEANSLTEGARFTKGTLGPGALSAEWSQLGPFAGQTKILGFIDACQLIKENLPGLLEGIGGGTEIGGFDIGSLLGDIDLSQLDDVNLGPSAITLVRTTDESVVEPPIVEPEAGPAKLKLSVSPRNRKAKPGSSVKYRVSVKNTGESTSGKVKVCVRTPKKAIRSLRPCRILGAITPGATRKSNFRVKLKKGAARRGYRISFQIRSGAQSKPKSSAGLRIR